LQGLQETLESCNWRERAGSSSRRARVPTDLFGTGQFGGLEMKKIVSAGIGLLALAGAMQPAAAADIAVKAPVYKAPPFVVDAWNWTGFYVGLNGGYSWGRSRTDVTYFTVPGGVPIVPPPGSITSANFNLNGGVFGAQAGYNWQSGSWVGGIETDIQWSGQKGSADFLCAVIPVAGGPCLPGATFAPAGATGATLHIDQNLQWFGTLRGRIGGLVTPSVLAYLTGGLAYGEIKTAGTLGGFTPGGVATAVAFSNNVTKAGWTIGGGLEGRLGGNWTGKVEYLYMDLGTVSGTVNNAPAGIGANWSSRITDNIFRVGVNYHFFGPVVAKY
jgi:outer membrane immunogenic protein